MSKQCSAQKNLILDILLGIIAIPILIFCALQLEKNFKENWTEDSHKKWIVLAFVIAIFFISIIICAYLTHRIGACLWTGPLEEMSPRSSNHVNRHGHVVRTISNSPPTYDSIIKIDIPPPSYDLVVGNEGKKLKPNDPESYI